MRLCELKIDSWIYFLLQRTSDYLPKMTLTSIPKRSDSSYFVDISAVEKWASICERDIFPHPRSLLSRLESTLQKLRPIFRMKDELYCTRTRPSRKDEEDLLSLFDFQLPVKKSERWETDPAHFPLQSEMSKYAVPSLIFFFKNLRSQEKSDSSGLFLF